MNLETWLNTATKNLAPRAAAKVRDEITSHIEDSLQYHRFGNAETADKQSLAIKDLGDPEICAKKFEKIYATKRELLVFEKQKDSIKKYSHVVLILFSIPILFYLVIFFFGVSGHELLINPSIQFIVSFPVIQLLNWGIKFIISRNLGLNNFIIANLGIEYLSMILVTVFAFIYSPKIFNGLYFLPIFYIFMCIFTLFSFYRLYLSWQKVKFL